MIKKITGNFQVAAILTDSWKEPSLVAPSPENTTTMLLVAVIIPDFLTGREEINIQC